MNPLMQDLVSGLNPNSSADVLRAVIATVAAQSPDPLTIDEAVDAIAKASGRKPSTILRQLKTAMAPPLQDAAIRLAVETLAQAFQGGDHLKHLPDGTFWRYADGFFSQVAGEDIEQELYATLKLNPHLIGKKSAVATVSAALKYMRSRCKHDEDLADQQPRIPIINMANGELWLEDDKPTLRLHTHNSCQTYRLPYGFDHEAECPVFIEAMKSIFSRAAEPEEMVRHVEELLAYTMQSSRRIPTIVCLVGAGANGKTTVLETLKLLLGPGRFYAASIGALHRDKFVFAGLIGKLAYLDDDVSSGAKFEDGLLKVTAEGKRLTTRRPYGKRDLEFECRAMSWMAMNSIPQVADTSQGLQRRLQIVPFSRRFAPSEMLALMSKLEAEVEGIFAHLVHALYRLRERGNFDPPAECLAARDRFRKRPVWPALRRLIIPATGWVDGRPLLRPSYVCS